MAKGSKTRTPNVFGHSTMTPGAPIAPVTPASPAAPKAKVYGGHNRPQMGPAPDASPRPPKNKAGANVFGQWNRPTNK